MPQTNPRRTNTKVTEIILRPQLVISVLFIQVLPCILEVLLQRSRKLFMEKIRGGSGVMNDES